MIYIFRVFRLFPESIRWQASHGKVSKALKTLKKAASWNGLILNEPAFSENVSSNGQNNYQRSNIE